VDDLANAAFDSMMKAASESGVATAAAPVEDRDMEYKDGGATYVAPKVMGRLQSIDCLEALIEDPDHPCAKEYPAPAQFPASSPAPPMQWHIILRYGSLPYTPTACAVGDVSVHSGFSKLQDAVINSIRAGDGFSYFKLTTTDPVALVNPVYVRTTGQFSDELRNFGWPSTYEVCRAGPLSNCSWESPGIPWFDTISWGDNCGRWVADYEANIGCYAKLAANCSSGVEPGPS